MHYTKTEGTTRQSRAIRIDVAAGPMIEGKRCRAPVLVQLIAAIGLVVPLTACSESDHPIAPTYPAVFTEIIDTPPSGDICTYTNCRAVTSDERNLIESFFDGYYHPDPICRHYIQVSAAVALANDRLFLGQSDNWLGGPFAGNWYNGGYQHSTNVFVIKDDYLASPGEFVRFSLHEAVHHSYGPNSESLAMADEQMCGPYV